MKGMIFNIQRFSLHDGPGIRSTVFLKGCPLDCLWCHNPESKKKKTELAFYSDRCSLCGECSNICNNHIIISGYHEINRDNCRLCSRCAEQCPNQALELIGRESTIEEIMSEVMKDKMFYETSGGGITLSGGEPLLQYMFAARLLQSAKEQKLHTCVDTSGFVSFEAFEAVLPFTDLFLYDWKESNDELHRQYTGVSNNLILENLIKLGKRQANIILRCPVIPTCNARTDHYAGIAELANQIDQIKEINIMPYHDMGSSKYQSIGSTCSLKVPLLTEEEKNHCLEEIRRHTGKKVIIR